MGDISIKATQAQTSPPAETQTLPPPSRQESPTTQVESIIKIKGWFTTIWNGEPHYAITDESGTTTQLILSDEVIKAVGGALNLDRKLLIISGEIVSEDPIVILVKRVEFTANP